MPMCRDLSGNELTRNLSGKIRPQSSQLAELLWTDPGIRNGGISVHELISTSKKKKKKKEKKSARRGMNGEYPPPLPALQILASKEKATTTTTSREHAVLPSRLSHWVALNGVLKVRSDWVNGWDESIVQRMAVVFT